MTKPKAQTPKPDIDFTPARAQALLQAEQRRNLEEAQQELQQMLVKRGLQLRAIVTIVGNQIVSDVQLVVAPQQGGN